MTLIGLFDSVRRVSSWFSIGFQAQETDMRSDLAIRAIREFRPSVSRFVTRSVFVTAVLLSPLFTSGVSAGQLAPTYEVVGLGTLPAGISSIAYGINDRGTVVGASTGPGGASQLSGFIWKNGSMTDLGKYANHTAMRPWGVNNHDHVAGRASFGPGGSNFGVYFGGSQWELAGWVGGNRGNAFGINDANQVVGNMRLPSGDFSRGFVWTPTGGTVQLPTLFPDDPGNGVPSYGGFEGGSYANAINGIGAVVGSSGITDTHGTDRGFMWTETGGMIDLGTPASRGLPGLQAFTSSYAQNINDAGTIVGAADRGPGLSRVIYWASDGTMHDLGTLGGERGWAYAINEAGVIVGASNLANGQSRAFGWDGGSLVDLNSLIDPGLGWTLLRANDINEFGWIVGEGTFRGVTQAVLLKPVPEPSAIALIGTGLAIWASRKLRNRKTSRNRDCDEFDR